MGSRLFCCVALCLLGAGPVDSEVTQTPRHLTKARGQTVTLGCSPFTGHLVLSWCQQLQGQGLQILIGYYSGEERAKGNISDRFSGKQFDDYSSKLTMSSLEQKDSALYLSQARKTVESQSGRGGHPRGPVDSGVSQTPKYLIKARKQQVTLSCSYISGHYSVYWYQQARDQGPQFLIEYYNGKQSTKGNIPDRFSVQQFSDYRSELTMSSLELTDSTLYLCASSKDTALHARQPAVQKGSSPAQEVTARVAAASHTVPGQSRADCLSQSSCCCLQM